MILKKVKSLFILMLAIIMLCCAGMTAYAQTSDSGVPPVSDDALVSVDTESGESGPEMDLLEEGSLPDGETLPGSQEKTVEKQQTESEQSGNTPYFIGAGVAVLVFIGVAVFCKIKGKN